MIAILTPLVFTGLGDGRKSFMPLAQNGDARLENGLVNDQVSNLLVAISLVMELASLIPPNSYKNRERKRLLSDQ
jgi:hypothetical protein